MNASRSLSLLMTPGGVHHRISKKVKRLLVKPCTLPDANVNAVEDMTRAFSERN